MNSSSFYHHLPKLPELPDFSSIDTYNWTLNDWRGVLKTFLVPKMMGVLDYELYKVLSSFLFFRLLQYTVRFYLFGRCSFRTFDYFKFGRRKRRHPVPSSTELEVVPPNKKWRTSNEAVSLIHSVVSGLWALYACVTYPDLLTSINTFTHPVPKFLVYVSFGYIAHDLLDLLINERSARILELLFHHVIVITAFLITLITNLFLGVVVLGLLMEVNSIFLHSRSLLNLYRQPKDSTAFKFIALLNILTFMVFRMAVSAYLLYWQISNMFTTMLWYHSIFTFVVIVSLTITNSILLYRVLLADGLLGKERARLPVGEAIDEQTPEFDEENDSDEAGAEDNRRISKTEATQTGEAEVLNNQPPDSQPAEIVVQA
ncbi:TRAM/LAG1/CLN8-like proteiny domain-containing protein [Aphelenchoides bicaudatus]|nr:TRAM/LAG1/CLN8-like proteiny domain-containing protein [Aphelenchoides bicaudatus]